MRRYELSDDMSLNGTRFRGTQFDGVQFRMLPSSLPRVAAIHSNVGVSNRR